MAKGKVFEVTPGCTGACYWFTMTPVLSPSGEGYTQQDLKLVSPKLKQRQQDYCN